MGWEDWVFSFEVLIQRINTHINNNKIYNLMFIANFIFKSNNLNISRVSWMFKALWLFKSIVVIPRSQKNIPRWDVGLPNVLSLDVLRKFWHWWGILVWGQTKLGQGQKYIWTTPRMLKDGRGTTKRKKKKGIANEEWHNCNKQQLGALKRHIGNTLRVLGWIWF